MVKFSLNLSLRLKGAEVKAAKIKYLVHTLLEVNSLLKVYELTLNKI